MAEVVAGAVDASDGACSCTLFGRQEEMRTALASPVPGLELEDASEEISNHEEPARAVRAKPDASIVRAAKSVAEGTTDALVAPGPTGAALAASLLHIKRLPGVYRPAVAAVLPLPGKDVVFLDVGANVEVRPEHLVQFAYMGAAFSEGVLGVERPRVGLLSIGEEPEKGTPGVVEAHTRLASGTLDFVGNVEGGDVPAGRVDVVVTDGFTGNVSLKLMEGTLGVVTGAIRSAARSGLVSRLGGILLLPALKGFRSRLDPDRVGGAYLLGLRRPVVICHGGSSRRAIASAVGLADRGVTEQVVERTAAALEAAGVTRGDRADDRASDEGGEPSAPSVNADTVTSRS